MVLYVQRGEWETCLDKSAKRWDGGTGFMKFLLILAGCAIVLAQSGCSMIGPRHKLAWDSPYKDVSSLEEGQIVHLPTGVLVTKDQLIDMVDRARIVYVGETHDNINAHKVELAILKALDERHPGAVAVGMEMLTRDSQKVCDQWTSGELDEKAFVKTWVDDWTNDYAYYRDILEYIRDRHVPLLALRASDDWLDRVKNQESENPSGQNSGEKEPLPEMDVSDSYHRSQIEAVFHEHPSHGEDFETFYKVQVLWDESMAQSIDNYLGSAQGRDKQVIVFAGSQHVEHGFGIPRRLFRRVALPYVIVLTVATKDCPGKKHKSMKVTMPEVPLLPGDFAWVVSYDNLEDKRVYLGVMIKGTDQGVEIIGLAENSAAEKAGIKKHDIITGLDGEPIKTSFDLTYLVGLKGPGDQGEVEILRDGKTLRFEVTFEARQSQD